MLQGLIVAGLVALAALYAIWSFLPMGTRQRLLDALAGRGIAVRAAAAHRRRLTLPGCGNCAAAGEHGRGEAPSRPRH
jgi:hypothetical protein